MSAAFDLGQHHRERTRRAEARAEHLERERVKLERLLAVCLDVACAGTGTKPLALLALLEEMLAQVDEIRSLPSTDDLLTLLRETS